MVILLKKGEYERQNILSCALELIQNKGFESVTMRTIGRELQFSATKIYKYFHNKDEVLIAIAIESTKMINTKLLEAIETCDTSKDKLKAVLDIYIDFSVDNRNHYEIIFGDNAPDYRKYQGTELDDIVNEKFAHGEKFLKILCDTIEEYIKDNNFKSEYKLKDIAINLLCILHGSVSFYNNKLLFEVCDDTEEFRVAATRRIIDRFEEVIM